MSGVEPVGAVSQERYQNSSFSHQSLSYQLEMHAALSNMMTSVNAIQKQQEMNAEESGEQYYPANSF